MRRADVRGHDDDGVAEVDRAALGIGQAAVVEDLQQHVEDVGVRLLDLVEEHDRVRLAAHGLGQLAALLVADVAGRGATSRLTVWRSWYSDMSSRTMLSSESNSASASACDSSVLPTPVGPEEDERADRAARVLDARARADDRVGHELDRLVLADDALVQDLVEAQQLLALALHQPA